MKRKTLRRVMALLLSAATLWTVITTVDSNSLHAALHAVEDAGLPQRLIRWELGDYLGSDDLPFCTMLALHQSPVLMDGRELIAQSAVKPEASPQTDESDKTSSPAIPSSTIAEDLEFLDNGAPSETVIPSSKKGYTVVNDVYIKNSSVKTLDIPSLASGTFAATLSSKGPQVLIIHTHASEAYSMPPGQEYGSPGTYRTTDARYNVIRVGDEIAATLSQYGISVLHDRALYDSPNYNGAYYRSMASIEEYMKKYPSLSFILDVHRDAIEDGSGHQYKVISKEDPHAAQVSFILGSDYDTWQENLKLAVAIQQTVCEDHPTLMRPITLRNACYNDEACEGSLLVEIGAAGNSLDEAIYAGHLFAQGFAKTIQQKGS